MNEAIDPSFGFTPVFFLLQAAILLVWLVLAILAIRRAAMRTSGAATPLWILLVFLVPFLGSITTLVCLGKEPAPRENQS